MTTPFTRDYTGRSSPPASRWRGSPRRRRRPAYSPMTTEVGQGLMASGINAGFEHGLATARLTLAVLSGRPPREHPHRIVQPRRLPVRLPAARPLRRRRVAACRGGHGHRPAALVLSREPAVDLDGTLLHPRPDRRSSRPDVERPAAPPRRARAGPLRSRPPAVPEDGRHRPPRRRHRPRLQQPADRHQRPQRADPRSARRGIDRDAAASVEEIEKAGNQAAALTRQLLAFSRKQMLQARVVELNQIVRELESMLGRLIGERIALTTELDPDLRNVVGRSRADSAGHRQPRRQRPRRDAGRRPHRHRHAQRRLLPAAPPAPIGRDGRRASC